jgi:hypothetical protein
MCSQEVRLDVSTGADMTQPSKQATTPVLTAAKDLEPGDAGKTIKAGKVVDWEKQHELRIGKWSA